ncbi:unnamed protein product [Leptidea sinapis]|uniref:Choline/carnitine acyltransferase domain-containing protein n=1 Tax=Leptidea sinapis TaxID=189913 RepID=A0A5E4Q904_9NEOP|nr:unnamed protein product [Leptidea sinapis]
MLKLSKSVNKQPTFKGFDMFSTRISRVKDIEYQYLQRSKVPTMHFQKSLPRLPIPELSKSTERYLNALKPLLSKENYALAEQRTRSFSLAEGKILQDKLIAKDKANKDTSYISNYWFDLYLRDRAPLPINYNPLLVFQNDSRPDYNKQLIRATNIIVSAARFMLSLRESILEPEVFHLQPKKSNTPLFRTITGLLPESLYGAYLFKAYPLDMSQFEGLFNATRIPLEGKDRILRDPKCNHVVVQKNGHFYTFDVLDNDGNLLSPAEILGNLHKIMTDQRKSADFPLGVLTSQNRDLWAMQRAHLEDTGNSDSLRQIDTAIFNLILDEDSIDDDKNKILKLYLHGDGTNRWYDKSFSLIVTKDGVSGINFEHSWGDGVAVLRFFQDVYAETTTRPFVHPDTKPATTNIKFNLDEKSKQYVENAKREFNEWCNSLSIDYILYEGLNKEACKKLKEFCDRLHLATSSKQELRGLMQECSSAHSQLVKEAAMGQGFDRHLFALMKIAEENNMKRPEIYDSHEYKLLNKSILSTSTLSSPSVLAGGYSAFPDKLGAAVASYKAHNNSSEFVEALHKSFVDITEILSAK